MRAEGPPATARRGPLAALERLLRAVRNRRRRLLPGRGTLDAFWEWDLQADTVVWHAQVNSQTGMPVSEQVGATAWWEERIHPGDRDRIVESTRAAIESDEDYWHDEYRFRRDDGSYADVLDRAFIARNAAGKAVRVVGTMTDITARKRVEDEIQARAEQQQAVAKLGQWALAETGLQDLLDDAVGLVFQTLRVDLCMVLERIPGSDSLVLRAGVGWLPGLVGRATVSGGSDSQAGFTLQTGAPVFVEDLTLEDRFSGPAILHDHGVVSGLSVVIQGPGGAFGVLAAHTRCRRRFTEDDSNFLLAVANVLAAAIARERADVALREQERLYRLVADSASDMVVLRDSGGGIRYVSPSCERLLGYTPDEFAALDDGTLVHPDHATSLQDGFAASALASRPAPATYLIRRKDGTYIWFESMATAVLDDPGNVVGIQTTSRDVTERKRAEEALRESLERFNHLAHHDPLTGLPNRVLLRDRLALALAKARRHGHLVGVAFLDLDRFKVVNDTLGHAMGDLLLQEVGRRLAGSVRSDDTVSRLGGDEFAVVLSELRDVESATHVGHKLLAALAPAFTIQGRELFVTGSLGMSLFPSDGDDVDALLRTADNAMYRAKEQGRDNLQLYADTMGAVGFERLTLETDLRKALDRGEIRVHYQPQIALDSADRVVAVEALARWRHTDLGLVPPSAFIPLAEETGLIIPLGEIILRTACADCRSLQVTGWPELSVAVNVSGRQLRQPAFLEQVKTILRESGLEPRHLQLEITENLIMQDAEASVGALRELRRLGIRLALDDFGTGHSSLGQMKLLTLDAIKIDRSFIRDLGRNRHDEAIVSAIVALARSLECQVIAEGVESEAQLRAVSELGCRTMQGYYFSRPLPIEECREFLHSPVPAGQVLEA